MADKSCDCREICYRYDELGRVDDESCDCEDCKEMLEEVA